MLQFTSSGRHRKLCIVFFDFSMHTDLAKEGSVYILSCTVMTLNVFSVWCCHSEDFLHYTLI